MSLAGTTIAFGKISTLIPPVMPVWTDRGIFYVYRWSYESRRVAEQTRVFFSTKNTKQTMSFGRHDFFFYTKDTMSFGRNDKHNFIHS